MGNLFKAAVPVVGCAALVTLAGVAPAHADPTQTVTLEATGSGTALTIDMDDPATAPRLYNQALPYNHTVNVALKSGDLLQIVVEPKGNEHPGCRILVNGKVVVEQPHGGMAQCVYNVP